MAACVLVGGCDLLTGGEASTDPRSDATQAKLPGPEATLDQRLAEIGASFEGRIGIAVHDIRRGETLDYKGMELLPQQSVSKLWVALTAYRMAERGALSLDAPVILRFDDLTVFHQPIEKNVLRYGAHTTTFDDLIERALTESDNAANDRLLREVGGPDAVRAVLQGEGMEAIRFGPGERQMQSDIAGLEWRQSYTRGDEFFDARDRVAPAIRRARFDAYVADPVDGASAVAVAEMLGRLARYELLDEEYTNAFLGHLANVKSGPNRLKGGLPEGWQIAHKTGTGQVLGAEQAGYNDVGILSAPDGRRYAVAVMIGRTARPVPERMEMMHRVVAAVAAYHDAQT